MPRVDVNHGARRLEAPLGRPLLEVLRDGAVYLPSACGGRGICGRCRLRVLDDTAVPAAAQTHLLTPEELQAGVRVACQVRVTHDLRVEVPADLLTVQSFAGRVQWIRPLTHDIRHVSIELLRPRAIAFDSGQYIELVVPRAGGAPAVRRAYSIASPPEVRDRIEIIVRRVPGGVATAWIFDELAVGTPVEFGGPMGHFRLSQTRREMIWIAGGVGMSPFWSMIHHMQAAGIVRPTTYIFGAAQRRDLFFVEPLEALAAQLPWFTFVPSLAAAPAEGWSGETGPLAEVIDRRAGQVLHREAYVCGPAGMVRAAVEVLKRKGVDDRHIFAAVSGG